MRAGKWKWNGPKQKGQVKLGHCPRCLWVRVGESVARASYTAKCISGCGKATGSMIKGGLQFVDRDTNVEMDFLHCYGSRPEGQTKMEFC